MASARGMPGVGGCGSAHGGPGVGARGPGVGARRPAVGGCGPGVGAEATAPSYQSSRPFEALKIWPITTRPSPAGSRKLG